MADELIIYGDKEGTGSLLQRERTHITRTHKEEGTKVQSP